MPPRNCWLAASPTPRRSKVWCIDKEAPQGPFDNLDRVRLNTGYDIYAASCGPMLQAAARYVKEHNIDQGKLGQPTGEGFFKYRAA